MANGVGALRLVHTEPAPAPSEGIEHRIGEATAFAVAVMSRGIIEFFEGGRLSPKGKSMGGEAVAVLYELSQTASHLDFATIARVHGLKILRAQHAATQHPPEVAFPEALADEAINGLLEIVAKVERVMAN